MLALMLAFGLAWLASVVGSAMIIGAFAAGLLLRETPQAHEIERGVAHLGHFFVPLFFVTVGAAVDVGVLNPLEPGNRPTLLIGGLLILVAVIGKFLAGYAPVWFKGNKKVIGVGMIPRGEVGLIFAQTGLASGVFDPVPVQCGHHDGAGDDLHGPTALEISGTFWAADATTATPGRDRRVGHEAIGPSISRGEVP